jgi:predicted small lipoprotein YifL
MRRLALTWFIIAHCILGPLGCGKKGPPIPPPPPAQTLAGVSH